MTLFRSSEHLQIWLQNAIVQIRGDFELSKEYGRYHKTLGYEVITVVGDVRIDPGGLLLADLIRGDDFCIKIFVFSVLESNCASNIFFACT
jgi:hypothetical protein